MIEVKEAQARIYAAVNVGPTEWVPLAAAGGRVLATDVAARRAQPPKAVSSMDGYAVRAADCTEMLTVKGEMPAGAGLEHTVGPGEAVRIFTGSLIPEGADAVLIQEDAERDGNRLRTTASVTIGDFVRPAGLDFGAGWVGLQKGRLLDPRAVGLAASLGHGWLQVQRRPRVAIMATGNELRMPGETPLAHQITSSNTVALAAMVRNWGGDPIDLGIVADEPGALSTALEQARGADLIVTTGGASVGDHDLVQQVTGEQGMRLDFWKIRMRPGKPLIFGELFAKPFIGLPGNAVSAMVCAIMFLRGAIHRGLGLDPDLPMERARLASDLPANGDRRDFMRARRNNDGSVEVADRQDSSMLATMARADVLLVRPPHDRSRATGECMDIIDLCRVLQPRA